MQWDETRFSAFYRDHRHALGKRKSTELTEEDKLLLPAWAYGFVLRSRRWSEHRMIPRHPNFPTNSNAVTLRIADLSEVTYENTFDELVL